jgi:hypothetical protein
MPPHTTRSPMLISLNKMVLIHLTLITQLVLHSRVSAQGSNLICLKAMQHPFQPPVEFNQHPLAFVSCLQCIHPFRLLLVRQPFFNSSAPRHPLSNAEETNDTAIHPPLPLEPWIQFLRNAVVTGSPQFHLPILLPV